MSLIFSADIDGFSRDVQTLLNQSLSMSKQMDNRRKVKRAMNVTEVRLRLELHYGVKRKPELVPVDETFKTAEDFQLDVVEVALNIDVPVVEVKEFTVSVFLTKKSC